MFDTHIAYRASQLSSETKWCHNIRLKACLVWGNMSTPRGSVVALSSMLVQLFLTFNAALRLSVFGYILYGAHYSVIYFDRGSYLQSVQRPQI